MPFFRKKPSIDAQKKLQHQLHLAKHGPDSIVDISGCELSAVPPEVYALCKVLLKEVLMLHTNKLRHLKTDGNYESFVKLRDSLRILDVHDNELSELPLTIGQLQRLQVLNLEQNRLLQIPKEIGMLHSLQTLNLKRNRLTELPSEIGNMISLRSLDISCNSISGLPVSLGKLRCLETLILDSERYQFPPADVCKKGTVQVMKFLCEAGGFPYQAPSKQVLPLMNIPNSTTRRFSSPAHAHASQSETHLASLAATAESYEKAKELKRKEQAQVQQALLDAQAQTAALIADCSKNKVKLLGQIAQEQSILDEKFLTLQQRKDLERKRLLMAIEQMEKHSQHLVQEILEINKDIRRTEQLLEDEEARRINDENMLRVRAEEYLRLRKAEIARAMEDMMAQNYSLENLRNMYEAKKVQMVIRAAEEDAADNLNVESVLRYKDKLAKSLLDQLVEDQEFQKEAVLALMEQRDARCNRINSQIAMIEQELAQLTSLEMRNKDLRAAENQSCLEDQRKQLIRLLMQLFDEKMKRNKELQKRLREMEKAKEDDQIDYWLVQYQKLLDYKPQGLIEREMQLDTDIVKILTQSGAEQFIPAFTRHQITVDSLPTLSEEDLQKVGIYQVGIRKAVLLAVDRYLREKGRCMSLPASPAGAKPSAPPAVASTGDLAPKTVLARFEMECVICMEAECTLVFIPCGHVCCCAKCAKDLTLCPLCRGKIGQNVDLYASPKASAPTNG